MLLKYSINFIVLQLFKTAQEYRRKDQGFLDFRKFDRKFNYGHKYICRAPELSDIIE